MKLAATVCTLALSALLAGCGPAVSVRPLYTPEERQRPVAEPRLEGEWTPDEGTDKVMWKISAANLNEPGGHYEVSIRCLEPKDCDGVTSFKFTLRLVPIGDDLFFDAQPAVPDDRYAPGWIGAQPLHLIGQLWVEKDFLRVTVMDDNWLERQIPEHLRVAKDHDIDPVFIGSTSELRELVHANADAGDEKGFSLLTYLCRPRTDCEARAVEDKVARKDWTNDPATFFLSRGNYPRAIAVQREYLRPQDAWSQAFLGKLLLFNRDFDGARRAYAAAAALAPSQTFPREGLVWSYFLERRFADAANAAGKTGSAEAIMLGYFSRLRLGTREEADSWLKVQASAFTGSVDDHGLLLRLEGRLGGKDNCEQPVAYDPQRATCVQAAIREIVAGDPKVLAAGFLERAMQKAPTDSLLALAARIESENLRSLSGR